MRIFSSDKKNSALIIEINALVKRYKLVVIEVRAGKAYFLIDHYKYIDYKKEAKRMQIGTVAKTGDGYYYFDRACEV
jgi:hypothetical protein